MFVSNSQIVVTHVWFILAVKVHSPRVSVFRLPIIWHKSMFQLPVLHLQACIYQQQTLKIIFTFITLDFLNFTVKASKICWWIILLSNSKAHEWHHDTDKQSGMATDLKLSCSILAGVPETLLLKRKLCLRSLHFS